MMDRVEDLIRDTVSKVRRPSDHQQSKEDSISCIHYFGAEIFTECFLPIRAPGPKRDEKYHRREKCNQNQCVAKMDMHSDGSIHGEEAVEKKIPKVPRSRSETW
jgi:hypothetical protein